MDLKSFFDSVETVARATIETYHAAEKARGAESAGDELTEVITFLAMQMEASADQPRLDHLHKCMMYEVFCLAALALDLEHAGCGKLLAIKLIPDFEKGLSN